MCDSHDICSHQKNSGNSLISVVSEEIFASYLNVSNEKFEFKPNGASKSTYKYTLSRTDIVNVPVSLENDKKRFNIALSG